MKTVIAIAICLAPNLGFASVQQDSSVKDDPAALIAEVQTTPAAKLDSNLPQVSLEEWMRQQIGH